MSEFVQVQCMWHVVSRLVGPLVSSNGFAAMQTRLLLTGASVLISFSSIALRSFDCRRSHGNHDDTGPEQFQCFKATRCHQGRTSKPDRRQTDGLQEDVDGQLWPLCNGCRRPTLRQCRLTEHHQSQVLDLLQTQAKTAHAPEIPLRSFI